MQPRNRRNRYGLPEAFQVPADPRRTMARRLGEGVDQPAESRPILPPISCPTACLSNIRINNIPGVRKDLLTYNVRTFSLRSSVIDGMPVLHFLVCRHSDGSAIHPYREMIELILSHDTGWNNVLYNDMTLLMEAAKQPDLEVFKQVLRTCCHADINHISKNRQSALSLAIMYNHLEHVGALLDHRYFNCIYKSVNKRGTVLQEAVTAETAHFRPKIIAAYQACSDPDKDIVSIVHDLPVVLKTASESDVIALTKVYPEEYIESKKWTIAETVCKQLSPIGLSLLEHYGIDLKDAPMPRRFKDYSDQSVNGRFQIGSSCLSDPSYIGYSVSSLLKEFDDKKTNSENLQASKSAQAFTQLLRMAGPEDAMGRTALLQLVIGLHLSVSLSPIKASSKTNFSDYITHLIMRDPDLCTKFRSQSNIGYCHYKNLMPYTLTQMEGEQALTLALEFLFIQYSPNVSFDSIRFLCTAHPEKESGITSPYELYARTMFDRLIFMKSYMPQFNPDSLFYVDITGHDLYSRNVYPYIDGEITQWRRDFPGKLKDSQIHFAHALFCLAGTLIHQNSSLADEFVPPSFVQDALEVFNDAEHSLSCSCFNEHNEIAINLPTFDYWMKRLALSEIVARAIKQIEPADSKEQEIQLYFKQIHAAWHEADLVFIKTQYSGISGDIQKTTESYETFFNPLLVLQSKIDELELYKLEEEAPSPEPGPAEAPVFYTQEEIQALRDEMARNVQFLSRCAQQSGRMTEAMLCNSDRTGFLSGYLRSKREARATSAPIERTGAASGADTEEQRPFTSPPPP